MKKEQDYIRPLVADMDSPQEEALREYYASPTRMLTVGTSPSRDALEAFAFNMGWIASRKYHNPVTPEEHPADVSNMTSEASTSPLNEQVGGDHYRKMAIQPIEYIEKNHLGFIEGNIVKYATRHRDKNGAEDVRKIIHYARLLLELEYGEKE